jgi:electron transport complex protein RnfG
MKETLKIVGVLTLVCVLCAFFLALVSALAEKKIALSGEKRIEDAITNLAPDKFETEKIIIGQDTVYKLFNKRKELIGYAFLAEGQGYQGKIKLLVVINPSLKFLRGIEVVESLETPGLGAKIQESFFKDQFKELDVSRSIKVQAITGATVSSRAVVNILDKRIEELRNQLP